VLAIPARWWVSSAVLGQIADEDCQVPLDPRHPSEEPGLDQPGQLLVARARPVVLAVDGGHDASGILGTTASPSTKRPPGLGTPATRASRSALAVIEMMDGQGRHHQVERADRRELSRTAPTRCCCSPICRLAMCYRASAARGCSSTRSRTSADPHYDVLQHLLTGKSAATGPFWPTRSAVDRGSRSGGRGRRAGPAVAVRPVRRGDSGRGCPMAGARRRAASAGRSVGLTAIGGPGHLSGRSWRILPGHVGLRAGGRGMIAVAGFPELGSTSAASSLRRCRGGDRSACPHRRA